MKALLPFLALAALACNNSRRTATAEPAPETEAATQATAPQSDQLGGPARADSLFLYLERTPCFGPCKAYRITVYRSGHATYDGRLNMEKEGPHTTRIEKEILAECLAKAREHGFFGLKDTYDAEVTDLPSTVVRIVADGKDKRVLGRVGQPEAFKRLVADLEALLLPLPWKPVTPEP